MSENETVLRRPVRILLLAAGTLSVSLGIIGIILPLVPTTPLLLLAAWCYARSSDRFYAWLVAHRWLGPYIRDFREGRGLTARAKASTLALLWLAILVTGGWVAPQWWTRWPLVAIAVGVTIYLLRLPTRRDGSAPDDRTPKSR